MDQDTALGIFRAILTSAGGAVVAHGYVNSGQWEQIVGAAVIVAGAIWSAVNKAQHKAEVAKALDTVPPRLAAKMSNPGAVVSP